MSNFAIVIIVVVVIVVVGVVALEFPLGGSSPYTSTDKINKNKYT
jgi:hypothetical protein